MPSASDIALYFIQKSNSDENSGELISNLKLQKLLYYAQGFYLATNDTPLFDDPIEAWMHGPVVPNVYHAYKEFGDFPITLSEEVEIPELEEDITEFLDEIYRIFGQYSAWKLRNMTHEEPPWLETWSEYEKKQFGSKEIMHEKMSEYFKTQLEI